MDDNVNPSDDFILISKKELQQQVDKLCVWTDDQPWATVMQAYRAGIRDLSTRILSTTSKETS